MLDSSYASEFIGASLKLGSDSKHESEKTERTIRGVTLAIVLQFAAQATLISLVPAHTIKTLDANPQELSVLFMGYNIALILGSPLIGKFADFGGRRIAMLTSAIWLTSCYVLMSSATSMLNFTIYRCVAGLTGSPMNLATTAMFDIVPPTHRREVMSRLSAWGYRCWGGVPLPPSYSCPATRLILNFCGARFCRLVGGWQRSGWYQKQRSRFLSPHYQGNVGLQ
eukprot:GHVN01001370.1.p1 GENE.GHVN01001370.1~~GHVN01001370.1.p1  ORF type:complete len:225 (+),score=12.74 GHVN01001370.1:55-729(+)